MSIDTHYYATFCLTS